MQEDRVHDFKQEKQPPECNINNEITKQAENFTYIGSLITDGKTEAETRKRMDMTKDAFQKICEIMKTGKYR